MAFVDLCRGAVQASALAFGLFVFTTKMVTVVSTTGLPEGYTVSATILFDEKNKDACQYHSLCHMLFIMQAGTCVLDIELVLSCCAE
jgi:hypothetical protein